MHISAEIRRIELALKAAGVSVETVLAAAHVNRSTWSRWKSEKSSPRMKNWLSVIAAAGKSIKLNAPYIPSAGSTAGHGPASSTHPIPETSESPAVEREQSAEIER